MNQFIVSDIRTNAANLLLLPLDTFQFPNASLLRLFEHIADFPVSCEAVEHRISDVVSVPSVTALSRMLVIEREFDWKELMEGAAVSEHSPIFIVSLRQ